MRGFGAVFGAIFGIIWVGIWIFVIASIIKAISAQSKVKNATKDVVRTVQEQLRQVNVHTGNPNNNVYRETGSRASSADAFSELRPKDSESFDSDLNPAAQPRKVKRSKSTVNGRRVRGDRSYGISSSERPAHGKLSRESRDDEKEWF